MGGFLRKRTLTSAISSWNNAPVYSQIYTFAPKIQIKIRCSKKHTIRTSPKRPVGIAENGQGTTNRDNKRLQETR